MVEAELVVGVGGDGSKARFSYGLRNDSMSSQVSWSSVLVREADGELLGDNGRETPEDEEHAGEEGPHGVVGKLSIFLRGRPIRLGAAQVHCQEHTSLRV